MPRIEKELRMEFKQEHQKLFLNVIFTANWLMHLDVERLRPHGISPQQYNILRILRGANGKRMNMRNVLECMLDRSPNATRLTDKLVGKGLVSRERCEEDRRVVYLQITPKGLDLLESLEESTQQLTDLLARKLSVADAKQMNRDLDKIRS
ncbi:MAG: MarR family transcriptional regulator [Flavobacteriales bacterium]|nr:MarR family transcriptional regulator [Flavobacteriales bacterium]MCL4281274.1 MarR family transcriptional regulator [Flavobacteriales bacterium]